MMLEAWLKTAETPSSVAIRARIIRALAAGKSNSRIARDLGVSRGTVILWRRRFQEGGVLSLAEVRPGRGRRPKVSARTLRKIVDDARGGLSRTSSPLTYRDQATACGVSVATIHRVRDVHGLLPSSEAPDGGEALASCELIGVFLDPPDRAFVLVYPRGMRPRLGDEPRMPARDLLRALDRFDRRVVGPCSPRDGDRALLKFLRRIERATPSTCELALVLDAAGGQHRRPIVRRWLAARSRYRIHAVVGVHSTADLLSRIVPGLAGRSWQVARASLRDDVCGYLAVYDGEPDRFSWSAADAVALDARHPEA